MKSVTYFRDLSFFFFWFFKTGFLCGFGGCPGTSSCRPGWTRTPRYLPASASQVLGLKACATTACLPELLLFGGDLTCHHPVMNHKSKVFWVSLGMQMALCGSCSCHSNPADCLPVPSFVNNGSRQRLWPSSRMRTVAFPNVRKLTPCSCYLCPLLSSRSLCIPLVHIWRRLPQMCFSEAKSV